MGLCFFNNINNCARRTKKEEEVEETKATCSSTFLQKRQFASQKNQKKLTSENRHFLKALGLSLKK